MKGSVFGGPLKSYITVSEINFDNIHNLRQHSTCGGQTETGPVLAPGGEPESRFVKRTGRQRHRITMDKSPLFVIRISILPSKSYDSFDA